MSDGIDWKVIQAFARSLRRRGITGTARRVREWLAERRQLAASQASIRPLDLPPVPARPIVPFALPLPGERPIVSIIIPAYDQWSYTYHCIASLAGACSRHSFEVLLADDGSTDGTIGAAGVIANLRVIRDGVNRRFVRNCNFAARQARGDFILLLNNDTECRAGAIDAMVEALRAHPEAGAAGSKLINSDGTLQEAGGVIFADGSGWNYGRGRNPADPEFNYLKPVDYVSGASLMVPRPVWLELGGFDEAFAPAYCEDSDFCFRVRALGRTVIYVPGSEIIHYEGVSNGTDTGAGLKRHQVENTRRLAAKWRHVLLREQARSAEQIFQARDRSQARRTILVIDHYVPQYDRDAGSRTMWAFLKALTGSGYNVKFIGDNFCAHQPYTAELQAMGVEVLHGPRHAREWLEWLRSNGRFLDLVLLSRPHISERYLAAVRQHTTARVVYYGHDLHFLREERRLALPNEVPGARDVATIRAAEFALMARMDTVLSCSHEEVPVIASGLPGIDVRYVPPYALPVAADDFDAAARADLLFVGGFGHTPNVDAVRWFVQEVMPGIAGRVPGIRLHVVGSNPPAEVLGLQGPAVLIHGFVSDQRLRELYAGSRIVVIPLRYGAGVKGKTVEAMAMGLPIVSTACGLEGLPEGMATAVARAETAQAFIAEVVRLYQDQAGMATMSLAVRQATAAAFSEEGMRAYWRELVEAVSSRPLAWSLRADCGKLAIPQEGCRIAGKASGLFADLWSGPRLAFILAVESADAPGAIEIEGWRPERPAPEPARIAIQVDDGSATDCEVSAGIFRIKAPCRAGSGEVVVHVDASWSHCPAKMGTGPDVRELSYVLRGIRFRPEGC